MKLKVFDRILLGILLIAAILLSFVLFGIAAGLIQEDMVAGFISLFYMFRENALILAGCGLVLLLISVKLLFAGRGKKTESRPASALMRQTEHGGTYISLEALDTMVQKHCRALARVRDVHTTLHSTETGVTIGIRLCVLPDTDVVTLSSELQKSLKENIEALTGIQVNEIGVLVESAAAPANTPAAVSRVE
ncbi:MAG: alkaline shock response membrane anchor protein AmaP [Clostridiales bacterium]|nr:alkaline shock response membrane anchor protein AmaP [Clostridiales bacterium]